MKASLSLALSAVVIASAALPAIEARALEGEARRALHRAIDGAEAGKWHWAALQAERTGDPRASEVIEWRRLTDGAPDLPLSRYIAFLEENSDWPRLWRVMIRAEESIDDSTATADVLALFDGREPRTRQGRIRYAQALFADGRVEEGRRWIRTAWVEDDFSEREERYLIGAFGEMLRKEDHEARLDRLLWDRRDDEAARTLDYVSGPIEKLAIARIRLQRDDPRLEAGLAQVPAALRRDPGLMYDRLVWRARKGLTARAMEILLDPPDDLVRPELWWRQRSALLRDLIDDGAFADAYRVAATHRQTEGIGYADAAWTQGWLALRFRDDPETALEVFSELWERVRTPISRARAAYWAGRAAEAASDGAMESWYRRAAHYPITFYGQLAEERLGRSIASAIEARPPVDPAAREAFERLELAQVAQLLCEAEAYRDVTAFLAELGAMAKDRPELVGPLLDLAENCGRPDLMARAAKAASREGVVIARALFPIPQLHGLLYPAGGSPDPALILAIARQESLFNPRAQSRAGALGLMQVLPSTAESVSDDLGLHYTRERLLSDPDYNARVGAAYIGKLIERYDGSIPLALAAYNAGPRRVARWLRTIGDPRGEDVLASIDWIERIPFAETRNYVQRVLEGHAVYTKRLAEGDAQLVAMARDFGPMTPPPQPRRRPAKS